MTSQTRVDSIQLQVILRNDKNTRAVFKVYTLQTNCGVVIRLTQSYSLLMWILVTSQDRTDNDSKE